MRISDWSSDVCSSDLIDENRLGNGPEADVDHAAFETEERRQHSQEEPRIDAEKQDLEDRVEGDERRDILIVTLRKLVPDDHHGDAAREADEDQARHIFGFRSEEHTSELQSLMRISYAVFCLKKKK